MINTWVPDLPQLNEAREDAGGCFLAGQVYVFAGYNGQLRLNTIEKIDAVSLVPNGPAHW